ncbi:type II toxin-antitoxin system VapC family toxin [Novosphingobium soli]|uniref:Type II toxin-antitoxin system VapC family toxin n=1 Tax=Novosphingobium soli TaxID=574956 RepID=A0ABV6CUA3_9SPHN
MILVDSCVLIDVFNADPQWSEWSRGQLGRAAFGTYLFVNPVVVGEVGWQLESYDAFHAVLTALLIAVEPLEAAAGHAAGMAYQSYLSRSHGNPPKLPLPDFFIGAHAQHVGATILTRDRKRFRTYFPDVPLITPETQP